MAIPLVPSLEISEAILWKALQGRPVNRSTSSSNKRLLKEPIKPKNATRAIGGLKQRTWKDIDSGDFIFPFVQIHWCQNAKRQPRNTENTMPERPLAMIPIRVSTNWIQRPRFWIHVCGLPVEGTGYFNNSNLANFGLWGCRQPSAKTCVHQISRAENWQLILDDWACTAYVRGLHCQWLTVSAWLIFTRGTRGETAAQKPSDAITADHWP